MGTFTESGGINPFPLWEHCSYYIAMPYIISRSRSAIFAITTFNGKCQTLKMSLIHFGISSYLFRDIKKINLLPPKGSSKLRSAISAITLFGGNCKNLQTSCVSTFLGESQCIAFRLMLSSCVSVCVCVCVPRLLTWGKWFNIETSFFLYCAE